VRVRRGGTCRGHHTRNPKLRLQAAHCVSPGANTVRSADRSRPRLLEVLSPRERRAVGCAAVEAARGEGAADVDGQGGEPDEHDHEQGDEREHLSALRVPAAVRHGWGSTRNCATVVRLPLPGIQGKKIGTWWWIVIVTYATAWLFAGGHGVGGAAPASPFHVATTFAGLVQPLLLPISELEAAIALAVVSTSTVPLVQPFWVDAHRPVSRATWVSVFCPQKITPNWTIAPTRSMRIGNTIA